MKIDYQKTFDSLKAQGIIADGDKYAVCVFQPETKNYGVVSQTITSKVDYVMTVNDEELKLFDIDKQTGEYLDSYIAFKKSDLTYGKLKERRFIWASKGLFGGMYISVHFVPEDFVHGYILPKKLHGFAQLEARAELYNYVKTVYNTYYDEQKRKYKESK